MKPFILVIKNKGFIEEGIKGHICEATPKNGVGEMLMILLLYQSVY